MINVLCLFPRKTDATSFYRGLGPLAELCRSGKVNIMEADAYDWTVLSKVNVLFMQRPFRETDLAVMKFAKQMGIKVWVDYDDDLRNVQRDNPTYELYNREHIKKAILNLIEQADKITVSTSALKSLREDAIVIPNSLNTRIFDFVNPNPNSNIIAWRGTDTHQKDLFDYRDEFKEISDQTESTMFFLGYHPWFITENLGHKKWVFAKGMDIIDYHEFIRKLRPKVLLVPLHETLFNEAKSNIAWIEATLAGTMVVAPDMPEWRRPGVFNYKDHESFKYQALKAFKAGESVQRERIEASKSDILENYNLSKNNLARMQILEELAR